PTTVALGVDVGDAAERVGVRVGEGVRVGTSVRVGDGGRVREGGRVAVAGGPGGPWSSPQPANTIPHIPSGPLTIPNRRICLSSPPQRCLIKAADGIDSSRRQRPGRIVGPAGHGLWSKINAIFSLLVSDDTARG